MIKNIKNEIPIVMICDSNYIIPTCVTLTSLILNKKETTSYHIHIIGDNLTEEDKRYFYEFKNKMIQVSVINGKMDKLENLHKNSNPNNYCVASEAALLKFEIPNLITNYDKVIYLDGDLICRRDLTGVYSTILSEQYAAVVLDSGKLYTNRELVKRTRKYFNSGVMLLNLNKMRKEKTSQKLIEVKRELKDNSLMDQNTFNIVFGKNTKLLPIKYNFLYINLTRAYSNGCFSIEQLNEMFGQEYESLDAIRAEAYIIHFASKDKPWKYHDVRLANEWYQYFEKSPVRHMKLERKSLEEEQLPETVKKLRAEVRHLNALLAKRDQVIAEKTFHIEELWKSQSMKIGRGITIFPRHLRKIKERIHHKKELLKYQLPKENCLNIKHREHQIIISLTTYSTRIETVSLAIASIMHQSVKPDRILLYLDENEYNMNNIPQILKKQQNLGVEIIFCEDLKSHKKYYFAMKDNPDAIIITIDDDVLYRSDLIESLYNSYKLFPNAVSAMRVHRMKFDESDRLISYNKWKQRDESKVLYPSISLFPTGCGGVLYPPKCLHTDVFDVESLSKLCLCGDDIWLKIMAIRKNTKTVLATKNMNLEYIDGTQEIGLFNQNVFEDKNDAMLKAVIDNYFEEKEFETNIKMIEKLEKTELVQETRVYNETEL